MDQWKEWVRRAKRRIARARRNEARAIHKSISRDPGGLALQYLWITLDYSLWNSSIGASLDEILASNIVAWKRLKAHERLATVMLLEHLKQVREGGDLIVGAMARKGEQEEFEEEDEEE